MISGWVRCRRRGGGVDRCVGGMLEGVRWVSGMLEGVRCVGGMLEGVRWVSGILEGVRWVGEDCFNLLAYITSRFVDHSTA